MHKLSTRKKIITEDDIINVRSVCVANLAVSLYLFMWLGCLCRLVQLSSRKLSGAKFPLQRRRCLIGGRWEVGRGLEAPQPGHGKSGKTEPSNREMSSPPLARCRRRRCRWCREAQGSPSARRRRCSGWSRSRGRGATSGVSSTSGGEKSEKWVT